MAETHQDGGAGGDFDLSQFYQIFFEEAGENLDQMEQMLLNLNLETADDEELNGIFRCAHSVKGGAATFGFADVAELTLDRLRRHELQPTAAMVDVLLESADASRSLLARHQAGDEGEALPTADLVKRISVLAAGGTLEVQKTVAAPVVPKQAISLVTKFCTKAKASGPRSLQITVGPLDKPEQADAIQELFRDIPGLGDIKPVVSPKAGFRVFQAETSSTDEELLDLFAFHVSREKVQIEITGGQPPADPGFGFFDGAAGAPAVAGGTEPAGARWRSADPTTRRDRFRSLRNRHACARHYPRPRLAACMMGSPVRQPTACDHLP